MSGGKAASLAVGKFREPGDFVRGKFPVRQPLKSSVGDSTRHQVEIVERQLCRIVQNVAPKP